MSKLKTKLKTYNPLVPLGDNIAEVKNAVEMIVSIIIRSRLPFIQVTLVSWFGADITVEILALSAVIETVIVYNIISAIEFFVFKEVE